MIHWPPHPQDAALWKALAPHIMPPTWRELHTKDGSAVRYLAVTTDADGLMVRAVRTTARVNGTIEIALTDDLRSSPVEWERYEFTIADVSQIATMIRAFIGNASR